SVLSALLADRSTLIGAFGDIEQSVWQAHNLGEVVSEGDAILEDSFFGVETPFAYTPTALFQGFAYLGIEAVSGNAHFAYNFVVIVLVSLSFCAMYAVLRLLQLHPAACVVGGLIFALAPATINHVYWHFGIWLTFLIPPYLYLLFRAKVDPQNLTTWALLGATTGGLLWMHEYFGVLAALVTGFFLLRSLFATAPLVEKVSRVAVCSAVAFVLAAPVIVVHLEADAFSDEHGILKVRTASEGMTFASTPANYFFPADENFVYEALPEVFAHANKIEHLNYLGLLNIVAVMLVAIAATRGSSLLDNPPAPRFLSAFRWELIGIFLLAVIMSLGPLLFLNSNLVKLPVNLVYLYEIPVLDQIRSWGRFGIFAFAVVTFVTAHLLHRLFTGRRKRAVVGATVALMVFVVVDQYPTDTLTHHEIITPDAALDQIESDPDNSFVLHLPLSTTDDAVGNATAQFFQAIHGHPIVNGYAAFTNPEYEARINSTPLGCLNLRTIIGIELDGACSPEIISGFLQSQIGYIVYEKITPRWIDGVWGPDEDFNARSKIEPLIAHLLSSGAYEEIYEDADYRILRAR
ncbi:MAG: hypothetical protein ACRDJI_02470, partial [Actinomycetota bacterium]